MYPVNDSHRTAKNKSAGVHNRRNNQNFLKQPKKTFIWQNHLAEKI
jgi:hypothetical protein